MLEATVIMGVPILLTTCIGIKHVGHAILLLPRGLKQEKDIVTTDVLQQPTFITGMALANLHARSH